MNIYAQNNARSTAPSILLSLSDPAPKMVKLIPRRIRRTVTAMLMGMSFLRFIEVIPIGRIIAVIPRMSIVLKMLEPITLPTAMSALPLNAPMKLTTISGADVPIPTMVSPMTNSLMPNFLATEEEPSTRASAPPTTRTRPAININI